MFLIIEKTANLSGVQKFWKISLQLIYEPCHEKTNVLHMQKQSR